ncbi:hypothetical protein INS49_000884 [Diaporthe citri]|uniref:uncharacterized protein n=1 Tax=Diaporthe citri TaxID=83186 RepID=UPI001C826C22|nr:uncharacterized protein INS49_000884 [Diaporthe citri]KAG6366705.1 hypothetical protein INS49_000884 [Diaporthe citri]
MAHTMGTPVKAFKKKKAFAFLKSAPKPSPSVESNGEHFDKEAGEDDDGLDLFRRSRDFFPVVVQEQEHRQTTPEEKSEERNRLSQESTQSPSPPSSKRRKLSSPAHTYDPRDAEEDLYGPPTPPRRVTKSRSPPPRKSPIKQSTPSPVKSKRKERMQPLQSDILLTPTRSSSNQPCANEVIALDDDEDDDNGVVVEELPAGSPAVTRTASTRTSRTISMPREEKTPSPGPITIDDSDDDVFETPTDPADDDDPFAHFIQRAREREAAAKAEAAAAASSRSEIQPSTPEGAPRKRREPLIEVKIFVQSRMARFPDVPPFGAKRGMSQNLGVIRRSFLLWLRKMGHSVSEEDEANIFLTWKRRKIYDVSTGVSLGWNPSVAEDSSSSSTPGFMRGGVLLEAWTQEDFDGWLAEEEKQRMMKRGDLVEDVSDEEPVEEQVDNARVRVTIKEKDQEPFKFTAYVDMEIRLMILAIRQMRKIPNDREIKLRYEGEWLEGGVTVQEADIEDHCTVEMYLR